jgi:hypothetical protein
MSRTHKPRVRLRSGRPTGRDREDGEKPAENQPDAPHLSIEGRSHLDVPAAHPNSIRRRK